MQERQQIWQFGKRKEKYSHKKLLVVALRRSIDGCHGEDKSREPNEIAVKATCLPHTVPICAGK
jgi:hypothetical protein